MSSTKAEGVKVCVLCPSVSVKVGHELWDFLLCSPVQSCDPQGA